MEFKSLIIKYKEDVDSTEQSLIEDYWKFEYPYYKSAKLHDLTQKYSYSSRNITDLIRRKCYAELYCHRCNSFMGKFGNKSELQIERFYERGSIICDDCWIEIKEPIVKEVIKEIPKYIVVEGEIGDKLLLGIKMEKWHQLNQIELETLIKITENIDKNDILNAVLIDRNWFSEYNDKYWKILNKLDKMNLIFIERISPEDRKIIGIHYHGRLGSILKENYPSLFLKVQELNHSFTPMNIKIDKLVNRKNEKYPNYSTLIRNSIDRLLKKDQFYQFSVWENQDGIGLKIINLEETEANKLNLFVSEEE